MSLIVLDVELIEISIFKELGLFIDGCLQGFSFCPPETYKPNKQTTWNTSRLHEIAWSSGKLDHDQLFAVFYDMKIMNAEVFAKGLKRCRLLTGLLGQNLENLDDYGCRKTQDLVEEGKTDSSWIWSSYFFRHKTRLHCDETKAMVYGGWAMQHLNLLFLYLFFVFVFTTNSILSTRHVFLKHSFWKIEPTNQMTQLKNKINLGKIVCDDNN